MGAARRRPALHRLRRQQASALVRLLRAGAAPPRSGPALGAPVHGGAVRPADRVRRLRRVPPRSARRGGGVAVAGLRRVVPRPRHARHQRRARDAAPRRLGDRHRRRRAPCGPVGPAGPGRPAARPRHAREARRRAVASPTRLGRRARPSGRSLEPPLVACPRTRRRLRAADSRHVDRVRGHRWRGRPRLLAALAQRPLRREPDHAPRRARASGQLSLALAARDGAALLGVGPCPARASTSTAAG